MRVPLKGSMRVPLRKKVLKYGTPKPSLNPKPKPEP